MDIKQLMKELTTEEKIGQLLQLAPFHFIKDIEMEVAGHVSPLSLNQDKIFLAGSVLGIGHASEMISVQEKYLKKSRHKIPLMFMADIIHGYETIFPVPLALSCTWHESLIEKVARISAVEAQTAGIHVTFSPMADLVRDPRWGRVVESFGEDPYLQKVFARAMVNGYQNNDISKVGHVAACVKHFAAYGLSEAGRDYNTVDLSRSSLQNNFLSGYQAAIEAGAKMIMTAFNVIDGVPATINKYLLRDVLRKQWHFDGVTISDYDSLHQVIDHGCAENDEQAALKGIEAGLDIEMASTCYINHLTKHVKHDPTIEILLNQAVERVLILKKDLGLFDNPYKGADVKQEKCIVRAIEHLEFAQKVAEESVVLLKNDQTLPIENKKIALIGPYATSKETNGPWSWHGNNDFNLSLEEAFIKAGSEIIYVNPSHDPKTYDEHDCLMLRQADVIVAAVGETTKQSGEAHSRSQIELPFGQEKLITFAKTLGQKVVTVLYNGRPLILENIQTSDAIVETWFTGSMGNQAIVDILTGKVNPSGKLTMSFPRNVGQIPIYYNHLNTGRPKIEGIDNEFVSYYLDVSNQSLYPFGYGLSYSTFDYKNLRLSATRMTETETITASIDIINKSDRGGYEIIQLYLRDYVAGISRPVMELKGFKKVWIKAFSKETITFDITKDMLGYKDENGMDIYEQGRFKLMIGKHAEAVISMDFDFIKE
jgi:beta-glucosidase